MKTADRVAVIYGVSVVGAVAVSLLRGHRGADVFRDAALHGVVLGTSLNVVGWLVLSTGEEVPLLGLEGEESEESVAHQNMGTPPNYTTTGILSSDAIHLLETVNAEELYKPMKSGGVKVAALPANPSVIMQDAT